MNVANWNVYGMYLFGYGNFVSTAGDIGFTLTKHTTVNAGYQLGSRLNVNGTSDRIALDLTQKGPLLGLDFPFSQFLGRHEKDSINKGEQ